MPQPIPVFDGHNDTLLRLAELEQGARTFIEGSAEGHIDLPRAREGGFVGGLFACYTPSQHNHEPVEREDGSYTRALADTPDLTTAQRHTLQLAAQLFELERESGGAVRVCRSAAEIRSAVAAGAIAAVFHIEGAEAIDEDLDALYVFEQAGLRSLGPVWSRENRFATGVPFNYPGTPDVGPGLTDLGRNLVKACNELRIAIDLSHLNEKGFWDVAALSDRPLIASHSNAHAICPVPRNLTDRQLDAIAESGGLVGLNFSVKFLDPQARLRPDLPFGVMVQHLDHLIERVGVGGVALGSDFDGATMPAAMGDVSRLPRLIEALREHGYDDATLRRVCFDNWLDVLERSWS